MIHSAYMSQGWQTHWSALTSTLTALEPLTQLSEEIYEHKDGGQEIATVPRSINVIPLFTPLEPHADAILQEGADQAQAGHMGEVLLRHPQELRGQTAQLAGKGRTEGKRELKAQEIIGDPCIPQTPRSAALMHTGSTTSTEEQGFNEVFLHSSFRTRGRGGGIWFSCAT